MYLNIFHNRLNGAVPPPTSTSLRIFGSRRVFILKVARKSFQKFRFEKTGRTMSYCSSKVLNFSVSFSSSFLSSGFSLAFNIKMNTDKFLNDLTKGVTLFKFGSNTTSMSLNFTTHGSLLNRVKGIVNVNLPKIPDRIQMAALNLRKAVFLKGTFSNSIWP